MARPFAPGALHTEAIGEKRGLAELVAPPKVARLKAATGTLDEEFLAQLQSLFVSAS